MDERGKTRDFSRTRTTTTTAAAVVSALRFWSEYSLYPFTPYPSKPIYPSMAVASREHLRLPPPPAAQGRSTVIDDEIDSQVESGLRDRLSLAVSL